MNHTTPKHVGGVYCRSALGLLLCPLLLAACSPDFEVYYNTEALPATAYRPLERGQRPVAKESQDLPSTLQHYLDSGYVVIGTMEMDAQRASLSDICRFAADKGASLVLYSTRRTGSIEKTYVVPVSHSATSYHSGSINGGFGAPSYNYHGTTTTTSTEWQQRNYTIGCYDQRYFFLAPKA